MSERFQISELPLAGLKLIERRPLVDQRGWLQRFYCVEEFHAMGLQKPIVQINMTSTKYAGTVRGLHFQYPPAAETKVISCLRGRVFDVAVDLRRGSPTFLQWHAEILSPEAMNSLLIPEGFAHGFQTLTDECEMLYFHTAMYRVDCESGLSAMDPRIAIDWPNPIASLSDRDRAHALLTSEFVGIEL